MTQVNLSNNHDSILKNQSRVWLITGCSTGFGRALAEAVLKNGDRLIATARQPEQLHDLVEQYQQQVCAIALDVTDQDGIHSVISQVKNTFGRIDVLVNNAGYGTMGAIEEVSDQAIHRQFDTNVFGTLNMIRAVLPIMRQQRRYCWRIQKSYPVFGLSERNLE